MKLKIKMNINDNLFTISVLKHQFHLSTLQTQERLLLKVNIYLTFFYKLNGTIIYVHKFLVSVTTFAIFQTKNTCKKKSKWKTQSCRVAFV